MNASWDESWADVILKLLKENQGNIPTIFSPSPQLLKGKKIPIHITVMFETFAETEKGTKRIPVSKQGHSYPSGDDKGSSSLPGTQDKHPTNYTVVVC